MRPILLENIDVGAEHSKRYREVTRFVLANALPDEPVTHQKD